MFKNLKISTKLLLGFGVTTLIMILVIVTASHTITRYTQAVESMQHGDQLKASLNEEERSVLQLLAGFEKGKEGYVQAHGEVGQLKSALEDRSHRREMPLLSFIEAEQQVDAQMFDEGEGFFDKFREAKDGFVEKNNKHVRRVLGYRNGWVDPGSAKDDQVLNILDNIRRERILVEDFNPRSANSGLIIQEFRDANDAVVSGLVDLWAHELEVGIRGARSPEMRVKLQTLKKIVPSITAISFPPISPEDARILGVEPNAETLFGVDADLATRSLTASCEQAINVYEESAGARLWDRADVPDVGDDVTPTLTLGKVVSCQQGLRVNAEDIFQLQLTYVNEIEPQFAALNNNIDEFRTGLSNDVATLAKIVQYFSLIVPVVVGVTVLLLIALMARIIVKPISAVQQTVAEFAKGNLDQRVEVTSADEIGALAASFNNMAEILQSTTVSKNYVDNIMTSMTNILVVSSPEGIIRTANRHTCSVLDYSESEITAVPLESIFLLGRFGGTRIVDLVKKGPIHNIEAKCVTRTGEDFPISFSSSLMHDTDGQIAGIVCVAQDISERKQAEEALREANESLEARVQDRTGELKEANERLQQEISERTQAQEELSDFTAKLERSNRELQDFASVAAHDLQEPLRKVQAFGERLQVKCGDQLGDDGKDYLSRMQNAAGRMRSLIDDLLTFSRVTTKAQPFVPVDLNQVMSDVLSDLEIQVEQAEASVAVESLPTILADPTQIRQLFQNLVGNALKFHRPEAPPVVKVYGQLLTNPSLNGNATPDGICRITVEDNGIGFDEKYVDRLFTIFQRLHGRGSYEGNGVGLAVCRKIAERHSGTITAKSAEGEGATFIINLPIAHDKGESLT